MNAPARSTGLVVISTDDLRALVHEAVADALAEHKPAAAIEKTLSGADMAEAIGISRSALHKLRTEEDCPAHKIGDHFRFFPSEVEAWIKGRASK